VFGDNFAIHVRGIRALDIYWSFRGIIQRFHKFPAVAPGLFRGFYELCFFLAEFLVNKRVASTGLRLPRWRRETSLRLTSMAFTILERPLEPLRFSRLLGIPGI